MCKVRITNWSNNYTALNNTEIETDIPSEMFPVLEQLCKQLNETRKTACYPKLSIKKIEL